MKTLAAIETALEAGDEQRLRELCENLHPADAAAAFTALDEEQQEQFGHFLGTDALSLIASYLPAPESADLVAGLPQEEQVEVLESLPDDVVTDLIQEGDAKQQAEYIDLLSGEKQEAAQKLLSYPEDSAGGWMTTGFATLRVGMTVRDAVNELEEIKEDAEILARIYVVDDDQRIIGKVRLRDLTFNPRSTLVRDIMDDERLAIDALADQEEAVQMILKYDLLALPVVDSENRLLGIITHDDALEIQTEESTEDLERAAAIGGERDEEGYLKSPVATHFKRRAAWVFFLAVVAILSGLIIFAYEKLLDDVFVLAIYMPMIVATGGNTGAQAATMVIRAMSLGEFTPAAFMRVIWKELRIGLALGALLGLLIAIGSWAMITTIFVPNGMLSVPPELTLGGIVTVVGIALTVQVVASTTIGAALPMIARACNLDPAVVASPAITTVVDVLGLLIYFSLASAILGL